MEFNFVGKILIFSIFIRRGKGFETKRLSSKFALSSFFWQIHRSQSQLLTLKQDVCSVTTHRMSRSRTRAMWPQHDWKFDRTVHQRWPREIMRMDLWRRRLLLLTCRLIHASNVKITYLLLFNHARFVNISALRMIYESVKPRFNLITTTEVILKPPIF